MVAVFVKRPRCVAVPEPVIEPTGTGPGTMVATPFPFNEKGRSVALTGKVPNMIAKPSTNDLMLRKRFICLFSLSAKFLWPLGPYVLMWSLLTKHHTRLPSKKYD